MASKLKPLMLPQLVRERKRYEDSQVVQEGIDSTVVYIVDNTSSSDVTSPSTPTFSHRSGLGHLRCSSSTSSLDLALTSPLPEKSASYATVTMPATPVLTAPAVTAPKRLLPDVQEEDPLEREPDRNVACYDQSEPTGSRSIDYDRDFPDLDQTVGKRREGGGSINSITEALQDTSLSSLTTRFGSRIQSLSRRRANSARRPFVNLAGAPASDPTLSHTPSSRSSSVSAPTRHVPEPLNLSLACNVSYYGSTDSICATTSATSLEMQQRERDLRASIEHDRAMATTPLLPPLFINVLQPPSASLLPLSIQSPPPQSLDTASFLSTANDSADNSSGTISESGTLLPDNLTLVPSAPSSLLPPPDVLPSPPLSTKISMSSFPQFPQTTSPVFTTPPSLEFSDKWSDQLGHANYTISPKPYRPEMVDIKALYTLRADWSQARINYTKHLVRTGEHYGTTSKTYMLTKAKWAETEQSWRAVHDVVLAEIMAVTEDCKDTSALSVFHMHDDVSDMVPRIQDAEGKFPEMGDEDIVGPMERATCMARNPSADERSGAARFWKTLAGRVGLRRHTTA